MASLTRGKYRFKLSRFKSHSRTRIPFLRFNSPLYAPMRAQMRKLKSLEPPASWNMMSVE